VTEKNKRKFLIAVLALASSGLLACAVPSVSAGLFASADKAAGTEPVTDADKPQGQAQGTGGGTQDELIPKPGGTTIPAEEPKPADEPKPAGAGKR